VPVDVLLADRRTWTVAERLEAELLVFLATGSPNAETGLRAALVAGAADGWVAPFLGHGERAVRCLQAFALERLHPVLAQALRPGRDHASALAHTRPIQEPLTPRELTILELLPTHLSYAQIGERLYLSVNTIKGNLKTIYRKLVVGSRTEAVEVAHRTGLL
jgi:LuxR family maltose regulon positive regulatory protein